MLDRVRGRGERVLLQLYSVKCFQMFLPPHEDKVSFFRFPLRERVF